MAVLLYLDRICIPFLEQYIREDLHLSKNQGSLLLSAFFWAYALGQVPAGWLSDRFGARTMLALYILLWSLFTGWMGLAESYALLVVFWFGCGLAQAGAYPTSAGIDAGVLAAPILPGLSDSEASLDAVAAAAASSGATFFSTRPLKLDPGVKPHYFAFLAEHFPALLPSSTARFADRVNPERAYVDALEERARGVRSRYRFQERPFRTAPDPAQLRLAI